MFLFYFFLLLASCAVIHCEDEVKDESVLITPDMMKAIQDQLDKLDFLTKVFKSLFNTTSEPEQVPEEARSEKKCIPQGSQCNAFSGPNCCGIRTRCYIWDYQMGSAQGHAIWLSRCKEYPLGKLLGKIFD